jgi:hypothetical protein
LFIKRPENTAIFFVKRFSEFGHLPFVSSLSQKIFCLEPLDFESSWDRVQNGREPDIPTPSLRAGKLSAPAFACIHNLLLITVGIPFILNITGGATCSPHIK